MIVLSQTALSVIDWIAQYVGLYVEFPDELFCEPLDEEAITQQLHYGRD
jgi:hypothetical protein